MILENDRVWRSLPGLRSTGLLGVVVSLLACSAGPAPPPPSSAPDGWIWSGAVTSSSARVVARLPAEASETLLVGRERELEAARRLPATSISTRRIATWDLTDLEPGSRYHYALHDGTGPIALRGTFRTFGEGPYSFEFAVSGCAATGSRHPVFDAIRERDPAFFLHLGDLHYENLRRTRPEPYRRAFEAVLASPAQAALYRSVPLVYVWDDHDYGGNDSDRTNPGRAAVRRVYRELVPHYPPAAGEGDAAIHQAFTVGRVRFLVTDSRSEKSPRRSSGPGKTVLGRAQKEWLETELRTARESGHAMVVLVTSLPWIGAPRPRADHWGGYAAERRELGEVIAEPGVPPVLLIAGDAHMLALDDGSNNRYAGGAGFPVFQAAALDRQGSVKGGPYSHGTFPGGGQYGWVEVRDDGETLELTITGRDARGNELLRYETSFPAP